MDLPKIHVQIVYSDEIMRAGLVSILEKQADMVVFDDPNQELPPDAADIILADYESGMEICLKRALRADKFSRMSL